MYAELQGALTVDMEDARSGKLLSQQHRTKRVHQTSKPSKRDKRVFEEVKDVMNAPTPGAVATTGVR